jgi:polar amino acid transport system substrate-binding protein
MLQETANRFSSVQQVKYPKERKMRKITWMITLVLMASLVLAACTPPPPAAPATTVAPTAPEAPAPTEEPMATEEPVQTEEPTAPAEPGALPDLGGKAVTVAVENAYPPFNMIDANTNEGVGWDYDTVTEICKRINCVPEFTQAAWDGIFPAMEAGEFDWLADGVTITEEREQIVDFSIPYVIVGQVLLVRADETMTVDEMKADETTLVGTQIGTTNEIVAKENFPAERVKSFEDFGASVLALIAGDIDGVVIDNVSASGYMKENEGKLKIAGQLTSDEQLGFVFPPGSELKAAVDAALQSMIDDGTLEMLNKKWGLVQ